MGPPGPGRYAEPETESRASESPTASGQFEGSGRGGSRIIGIWSHEYSVSEISIVVLAQRGGLSAVPWNLVLYTIPGAVLEGQLGSRFQGRISSEHSERLIAVLFVVVGIAFLYSSGARIVG